MYLAIRFRLMWAFVLFLFVVVLGLAGLVDPGAATAGQPAASTEGFDRLRVAPEGPGLATRGAAFPHWVDVDGDGCNTREEVLIAESASPAQVDPPGCTVVAGDWFSAYDGVDVTAPAELEVDHVVALAEAWDSGAVAWDPQRREAFANDLDEPAALLAVTSAANQAKADLDPAQWRPRRDDWCRYADAWVTVKLKWDLSADRAEVDALRNLLAAC